MPDLTVYIERLEARIANRRLERARLLNGGKLLADRSLSRLLKKSWPKSIDERE